MDVYLPQKVLRHPIPILTKDDVLLIGSECFVTAGRRFNGYNLAHAEHPDRVVFMTYADITERIESGEAKIEFGGAIPALLDLDRIYRGKRFDDFEDDDRRIATLRVKLFSTYEEQNLRGIAPRRTSSSFHEWIMPSWRNVCGPSRSDSTNNVVAPSTATFNRLFKEWVKYDREILAIMPRHHGPGEKAPTFTPESLNFAVKEARNYMSRLKPSKIDVYRDYLALLDDANEELAASGHTPLQKIGRTLFHEVIDSFPQFDVSVARCGEAAASKKYAPNLGIYDEVVPGSRCEIDELKTNLATIYAMAGVLDGATDEQKEILKRIRVWVVVIVDVATRYIVAAHVTVNPNARATLETLRLMMTDKTHISDLLGSSVPWIGRVRATEMYMDHGSAFKADEVNAAFVALRINPTRPPAGVPKKRPHIESAFFAMGPLFTRFFDGQTFRSIEEKGDYDPKVHASLAAGEFAEIITLGCIHYNLRPHGSLGGRSPHNAWVEAVEGYGWKPPPDRADIIRALGTRTTGQMTRDGIVRLGIPYNDTRLVEDHMDRGSGRHSHSYEYIYDDGYMNSILVKTADGGWIEVQNRIELPADLTVEEWTDARKEEREKNRAELEASSQVLREYLLRNRENGKAATLRAKLDPVVPSPAKLEKQRKQLFRGFVASTPSGTPPAADAPVLPPPDPVRGGTVARKRPAELEPAPMPKPLKISKLDRNNWDDE